MQNSLWLRLVLPLAILGILSGVTHHWIPADGFFLNLSTEFAGIVVTVAYVDWVLRRHEERTWYPAKKRIRVVMRTFVNATLSGFRRGLGYGSEILDESLLMRADVEAMSREVLRVAEHVVAPTARQRLDTLGPKEWRTLRNHMGQRIEDINRLMSTFGAHLGPSIYDTLLELQWRLWEGVTFYDTYPDIAGVDDDCLPETRTPPELLRAYGYDSTAAAIRGAVDCAVRIGRILEAEA